MPQEREDEIYSLCGHGGQEHTFQLMVRKHFLIIESGNEMSFLLRSEKAIRGNNEEIPERCWTIYLLMLLKTPVPVTLPLPTPTLHVEEPEKTNSDKPTEVGHRSEMA